MAGPCMSVTLHVGPPVAMLLRAGTSSAGALVGAFRPMGSFSLIRRTPHTLLEGR